MAKASSGRYKRIVKEVCDDLGCKPEDELCRHVSTLRLARENALATLVVGQRVPIDELLKLDEALKQYLPKREEPEIKLTIVSGVVGVYTCQHCHKRNEISDKPFERRSEDRTPTPNATPLHSAAVDAAPVVEPAEPAKPVEPSLTVKGYREGVSGSAFHAAVLSNNEKPPLKKLQPSYDARRSVSPISTDGFNDPAARRHHAPPNGSAFDDPNPNRKVN